MKNVRFYRIVTCFEIFEEYGKIRLFYIKKLRNDKYAVTEPVIKI